MMQNCINYGECRRPVDMCNEKCEWFNKTCYNCVNRAYEECGVTGLEVYDCSIPCESFEEKVVYIEELYK